jgi:hypothetical protein
MILYLKDPKNCTQKFLETMAGYKINLQKSWDFYTTNWEGIYGNNSIYSSLKKKIKYLGINLTKYVNDLYKENYKPWKKRSRKTTEGGEISHPHGLVEST